MIIYTKEDAAVVIPCGLGPIVCPDVSHDLQMKQVDPSTSVLHIEPDQGFYGLYRVIVNPVTADIDPDLLASNIKRGVNILGVTGTMDGGTLQSKTVDSSTSSQIVEPDNGNYGLSSVTVNPYTLESTTRNITANGTYNFVPTTANGLSSVDISVNVPTGQATLQSKTVNSSTSDQTVTPDHGYDGLSQVNINALTDPNLLSNNIKKDVTIFGVSGTFNGDPQLQSKTVDSSTTIQYVHNDGGYDGLSEVVVNPYTLDSKTVNPSTNTQIVNSSADGLSSVTVNAMNLQTKNVTFTCNTEDVIRVDAGYDGLSAVNVSVNIEQFMQVKYVNPSTNAIKVTPDYELGVDGMSEVNVSAVTSSIDANITAGNIKNGVTILGVTGDYSGQVINNQAKTVDSSTTSQSITFDNGYTGLSTVTVNPYTLDSKTVDSSTVYQVVTSSEDGLSSVIVNPYVAGTRELNKTSPGIVYEAPNHYYAYPRYDIGQDTLSHVIINMQDVRVDPSTVFQTIEPDIYNFGLHSVTINPYTVEANSSTLTQNGTYTFTPTNADALSSVTVDVSVDASAGTDWYTAWKLGIKHDFSDVDWSPLMGIERGLWNVFAYGLAGDIDKEITALPILGGTVLARNSMYQAFLNCKFSSANGGVVVSFPNLVSIGTSNVEAGSALGDCFYNVTNIKKLDFPELTLVNGGNSMTHLFSCWGLGPQLTEINMPKLQTIMTDTAFNVWIDDPSGASRKLTIHVDAIKNRTWGRNPAYWMGNSLTLLVLNGTASNDIYLENNGGLNATSVLNVLNAMGPGQHTCEFYTNGLTVTDDAQGSIQTAYNTAINNGWTINNLTIVPYS